MKLEHFYSGKRVFVTGHTGFKGTWLTKVLTGWGATVKGYALEPDDDSHFQRLRLEEEIEHEVGDICDGEKLTSSLNEFQPEIVFHLAAQALVRRSYDNPEETFSTNVMGSLNVLNAVRQCRSVLCLVYITSDKCYENVEWVWGYRETDSLGGFDPYSASKASAEILFSSYVRSFLSQDDNLICASARAGNVIGGGDYSQDRIIPDCIKAAQHNGTVTLRNPNATRPWQHVLEPISGYLMLGHASLTKKIMTGEAWNFGPASEKIITVKEVAQQIFDQLGAGSLAVVHDVDNPHEAGLLQLNCDKAHSMLGWRPVWSAEKAINQTTNWYQRVLAGEDPSEVTVRQIEEYFHD